MKKGELIGQEADIKYNKHRFKGTIIDETKNLVFLKTRGGIKKILKKNSIIKIGKTRINGKEITKRPEERIKK